MKDFLDKIGTWFQSFLSGAKDVGKKVEDFLTQSVDFAKWFPTLDSLWNGITGYGPQGKDIWNQQQNEKNMELQYGFERQLRQTAMQDTISDYQSAGVNPAIAFGSGPTSTSAPSGAVGTASGGFTFSDLVALLTLPSQLGLIKAQTKNVEAKTENTIADTGIKRITAEWMPSLNQADLDNMRATATNLMADVGLKISQTNYVDSQKTAQDITNEYLPQKLSSEIAHLNEDIKKMSIEERNIKASAWFTEIQANYAYQNKALMSNNDVVCIATYLGSLFGVGRGDVQGMISKAFEYMKTDEFNIDMHPWRRPTTEQIENWIVKNFGSKN